MAGKVRVLTAKQERDVVRFYGQHPNVSVTAKHFGVNSWNVKQCLLRNDIKINKNPKRSYRYEVNHSFLDDPSKFDERQAYFLGWMYSDGYLDNMLRYVMFSIADIDVEVLNTLSKMLDYSGPIRIRYRKPSSVMGQPVKKHQNRANLQIGSSKIIARLEQMGLDTRKSVSTGFPFYLKSDYWNHFVLGLFEGDGTFSFCESTKKCEANLIVNPVLSKDIEKILLDTVNVKVHFSKKIFANGAVILRFCGNNQLLKFFTWLYKNNRFQLTRKSAVFDRLIKYKKTCQLKPFERSILDEALLVNSALHGA